MIQDFLQDTDGDILIQNGDFVQGDSDKQHVADIIIAFPGWFKQFPHLGVGIFQYTGSTGRQQEISRNIKIHLTTDGYNVSNPGVVQNPDGTMTIKPNAER